MFPRYKLLLLVAVLILSGCVFQEERYKNIQAQNNILKASVDSLISEINDLKFGSKNLLVQARLKTKEKDFIAAKDILTGLINRYPDSKEVIQAKFLLKEITPIAENDLFRRAEKGNDIDLLKTYASEYPTGKYFTRANYLIKKFSYNGSSTPNYPGLVTYKKVRKRSTYRVEKSYENPGERTGAICCDGTRSYATGRGACSHHGGVCQWL